MLYPLSYGGVSRLPEQPRSGIQTRSEVKGSPLTGECAAPTPETPSGIMAKSTAGRKKGQPDAIREKLTLAAS